MESARTGATIFTRDDVGGLSPRRRPRRRRRRRRPGLRSSTPSRRRLTRRGGAAARRQHDLGARSVDPGWRAPCPAGDHDGDGLIDLVRTDVRYGVRADRAGREPGRPGRPRALVVPAATARHGRPHRGRRPHRDRDRGVAGAAFATATDAVLARADAYPDALAGAPLAAVRGGPLLLTRQRRLDERVAGELERWASSRSCCWAARALSAPAVAGATSSARGIARRARRRRPTASRPPALVADRVVAASGVRGEVLLVAGRRSRPHARLAGRGQRGGVRRDVPPAGAADRDRRAARRDRGGAGPAGRLLRAGGRRPAGGRATPWSHELQQRGAGVERVAGEQPLRDRARSLATVAAAVRRRPRRASGSRPAAASPTRWPRARRWARRAGSCCWSTAPRAPAPSTPAASSPRSGRSCCDGPPDRRAGRGQPAGRGGAEGGHGEPLRHAPCRPTPRRAAARGGAVRRRRPDDGGAAAR